MEVQSFEMHEGGLSPCNIDAIFSAAVDHPDEGIDTRPPAPWTALADWELYL